VRTEPSLAQTLRAVRGVRAHLRRTYPEFDHAAVHRILEEHDIRRYPDALMMREPKAISASRRSLWGRHRPSQPPPRSRKVRPLRLFSESYYRLANPDLRDSDLPLVLHWQVHGRLEGRSPHPFIDVGWLSSQIPNALPGEVVDVYLTDRTKWIASPSPYVETEAFMSFGPWDGTTHPLLQILRRHSVDPWIRARLGIIDLADADDALRLAAGVLTARNPAFAALSSLSIFEPSTTRGDPEIESETLRVVPGFVLADDSRVISSPSEEVLSGDGTAIRLIDGRVVMLDTRDIVACDRLIFVTSPLDDGAVETLVGRADAGTCVAPFDAAQQEMLECLGITTLAHSRQIAVRTAHVEFVGRS
jgi:hypothetical protein